MADPEKDAAQALITTLPIKTGDRFRHYKGGEYEVIAVAVKEDTLEPLVIYHSFTMDYIWARTYENFTEEVMVNGHKVKRFTPLA